MKILLDCGHTLSGADTGAIGNGRTEQQCTREIGYKVKSKLESLGHTVIVCNCDSASTLGDSLAHRVNKANSNGGDIYISIHLNAGGGLGTEVYTYGGKEITEARNVLNNIVALGFNNRGIKDGSSLYVLRNTRMKSMLIECCFIDTNDMNKYNAENFANAIVKGLVGKLPNQNTNIKKEVIYDMNKIVVYYGAIDALPALYVSMKYKCPMMDYNDYKNSGIKAKEVIQIGGQTGTDRYDTFKNAGKYL